MLTETLDDYISETIDNFSLSPGRVDMLEKIATTLFKIKSTQDELNVVFVCTHNSRRSHMAQVMFAAMVEHLEIDHTNSFSAGTEATEVHPLTISSLQEVGFDVVKKDSTHKLTSGDMSLDLFSKKYDHPSIKSPFVAIMVCDEADNSCPTLPQAVKRFSLPYKDPKSADGTEVEQKVYATTLYKIGEEMAILALLLDEKLES